MTMPVQPVTDYHDINNQFDAPNDPSSVHAGADFTLLGPSTDLANTANH
jgi:hypothetical protein